MDGNYQSNAFVLTAAGNGNVRYHLGRIDRLIGWRQLDDLSLLPAMAGLNPATDFPVAGGASLGHRNSGATATASSDEPAGSALPFGSVA